jgi:hypothetical protein
LKPGAKRREIIQRRYNQGQHLAGLGQLLIGNVDFRVLANMLIGLIPAVIAGAVLSNDRRIICYGSRLLCYWNRTHARSRIVEHARSHRHLQPVCAAVCSNDRLEDYCRQARHQPTTQLLHPLAPVLCDSVPDKESQPIPLMQ